MAIGVATIVSIGEESGQRYLTELLESVEKSRKPPGPRTMLSDDLLLDRREQFVPVFEGLWGEIGWELERSRNELDIIRAFRPLDKIEFIRELASIFYRESKGGISNENVHTVRSKFLGIQSDCRTVDELRRLYTDQQSHIDALQLPSRRDERNVIRRAHEECKKKLLIANLEWQKLSRQERELGDQLRDSEANFARKEVLLFIQSKRYALEPLNLANAIAGLPYMGWRQSMRRSIEYPSTSTNKLQYQIFQAIRYITQNENASTLKLSVAEFREQVVRLPSRHCAARNQLATQWLFLERAVRCACRSTHHPRAFAFEITKHYFREICARSQVDIFLASQVALSLPKQINSSK